MNKQIDKMAEAVCGLKTSEGCFCDGGYCNHNCLAYEKATDLYNAGYRKSTDVAREIFEEIERLLAMHFCSCLPRGATEHYDYYEGDLAEDIAELKKKYESEGADDVFNEDSEN